MTQIRRLDKDARHNRLEKTRMNQGDRIQKEAMRQD